MTGSREPKGVETDVRALARGDLAECSGEGRGNCRSCPGSPEPPPGEADHCDFFHQANAYYAEFDGFDPGWEHGSHPWSSGPSLDWLASKIE